MDGQQPLVWRLPDEPNDGPVDFGYLAGLPYADPPPAGRGGSASPDLEVETMFYVSACGAMMGRAAEELGCDAEGLGRHASLGRVLAVREIMASGELSPVDWRAQLVMSNLAENLRLAGRADAAGCVSMAMMSTSMARRMGWQIPSETPRPRAGGGDTVSCPRY